MSFDGSVVRALAHELNRDFTDGRIGKIYQPQEDELILQLRRGKNRASLLLSASSSQARFYLTQEKKPNPLQPPAFCMLLRKHLESSKIISFDQVGMDRVLAIRCQTLNDLGDQVIRSLYIEVMGRHSNIILVDEETGTIMDSIKRVSRSMSRVRQVLPGLDYDLESIVTSPNPLEEGEEDFYKRLDEAPRAQNIRNFFVKTYMGISPLIGRDLASRAGLEESRPISSLDGAEREEMAEAFLALMEDFSMNNFSPSLYKKPSGEVLAFSSICLAQYSDQARQAYPSMSLLLDDYYSKKDHDDKFRQRAQALEKNVTSHLNKTKKKLGHVTEDLREAENREIYKVYGDLLSSYAWQVPQGAEEVTLENFYDEMRPITIPLDKNKNPNQNAGRYYKRYSKLKHAGQVKKKQYAATKADLDYLENILYSLDLAQDMEDLDSLYEEFNLDFLKKPQSKKNKKKKKKEERESSPYVFETQEGDRFYVGKNSRQNDILTLSFAARRDYWFHVKEGPGSHVILKTDKDPIPEDLIYYGALLAAHFSKQRLATSVTVDYTQKMNVSRHPSKKKGLVTYVDYSSYQVDPDPEAIKELKIKS